MVIPLAPKAVYCFIDPIYGTAFRFFFSYHFSPIPHFFLWSKEQLFQLLRAVRAVTGRSHESLQQHFARSQDDFASFAKGGNYPSRISISASASADRWVMREGFYWTIRMAWQGVNKADANWSCQQSQERNGTEAMTAATRCCCSSGSHAITRWLQHVAVAATCCQPACCLLQLGNNCKQTFLMSFICFFLLVSFFLIFARACLKRKITARGKSWRPLYGAVARVLYLGIEYTDENYQFKLMKGFFFYCKKLQYLYKTFCRTFA